MLKTGLITKVISNLYTVNIDDEYYDARLRGIFRLKKTTPLVGDKVLINTKDLVIEKIFPRKNESPRPKVANIDYVLIISSLTEPNFSLLQLDKLILVYEYFNILPILIFTKEDLLDNNIYKDDINYYKNIGYNVFYGSEIDKLKVFLKGKLVFLSGESGVGKSTLINKLNPDLNIETKKISKALNRGQHTTRHVEIYKVDDFYLVDTPGFSNIDLNIPSDDIKYYFKEFNNNICKYKTCNHINEECELKKQVGTVIKKTRYNNYKTFFKEAHENSSKLYK